MPKQYPRGFREQAVRLVAESVGDSESEWSAIRQVATRSGVGPETVRKWERRAVVNAGLRPGVSESENVEIRRLKKGIAELRRTNEILRTASAFFAAKPGRPVPG